MADWSLPGLTTGYADTLSGLTNRDIDALTLCYSLPTNPPTGAIQYNRAGNKFQEYSGAAWVDKVLAVAGGGSGAADAATARTNFGLGSLATQNSNSVTITGGSIAGTSISGSDINSGTVAVARGGSGISSYSVGDILWASAATTLSKLTLGTATYLLRVNAAGNAPEYVNPNIFEPALGNPAVTGYVLSSTSAGVRSWIAASTPSAHQLDGIVHTVSGLTGGHFLKATGATTFAFAAHGLNYSDVGAAPAAGSTSVTTLGTITTGVWNAGAVTSSGNLVINGGTATLGPGTGAQTFYINGAAAQYRTIAWQSNGSTRWSMVTDNVAESGSNAGSNWELYRYTDAGSFNATALSINRATGAATFTAGISATTGDFTGAGTTTGIRLQPITGLTTFGLISFNNAFTTATAAGIYGGGASAELGFVTPTGGFFTFSANDVQAMRVSPTATTIGGTLTVNGFGTHVFSAGGNGENFINIKNTTAGTAAAAGVLFSRDNVDSAVVKMLSASYTTSGVNVANALVIENAQAGGLSIAATHASGAIRFYTGGITFRGDISADGNWGIGIAGDTGNLGSRLVIKGVSSGNTANVIAAKDSSDAWLFSINNDGQMYLNNLASGTLSSSSGLITSSSDERLKTIHGELEYGLSEVVQLRPIRFNWAPISNIPITQEHGGFGAIQVERFLPLAVSYDKHGYRSLDDRVILGAVVNSIKTLDARVKNLETLIH